jgi:hypothetical protein
LFSAVFPSLLISCNNKNFYQNKSDNMHKLIIFMTACLIAL